MKKNIIKKLAGDKKGFTLIELLVVIAIIGILAAVLMVNLSSTRNKAKDSAIKLEMGQIRTAMESYALSNTAAAPNNGYVGGGTDTEVNSLKLDIVRNGGGILVENISANAWCMQYPLNPNGGSWCVDSTGYAGATAACDATFDCAAE